MNHVSKYLGAILLAAVLFGCNPEHRQPRFQNAQLIPPVLVPGTTGLITVELVDSYKVVQSVRGRLREDQRVTFVLNDQGENGDTKAGDDIWSLKVDVPFQAPPGDYTLELGAFDADNQPVRVDDPDGNTVPLTTTLDISVNYEQESGETPPAQ